MAPFRNRDRSNRSGRGQIEHNVLEGLPINQYREVEVTIGPNSIENKKIDKDAWPEPPLPRDSHLLPEHSQQILRAARSGRIYRPPAPPQEEREDLDDEDEHKEVQQGFTIKKWVKLARHLEESEPEYLAKRRKGLPSQYTSINGQSTSHAAPLRETKVQKVDAEGNVTVYKALVPEGQTIEGEIQATDIALAEVAPASAAPGTVVEGVGVVNAEGVVVASDIVQQTPPRRKPPPKKKKGGPGRGKKKVVFMEGQTEQGTPASGNELLAVPAIKQEAGSADPSDIDTPMADAGEDEGDDDSGEEEGEEQENSQTPAESTTPANIPTETSNEPISAPDAATTVEIAPASNLSSTTDEKIGDENAPVTTPVAPAETQEETEPRSTGHDPSSSPEMPLSAISHSRQNSMNQVPTLSDLIPDSEPAPAPEAIVRDTPQEALPEPVNAVPVEQNTEVVPPLEAPLEVPSEEPILATEPGPVLIEQVSHSEPEPESKHSASESTPIPEPISEPVEVQEPVQQTEDVHISEGEQDVLGSLEAHLEQQSQ